MLPYGKQTIEGVDVEAVVEALRSPMLTTGPRIAEFEERFANYLGAKHAVAVCNGTAALHLALMVADVGPGDRVVTSPNTFLASANAAAYVGATPDFADIDPVSYNLCPRALEAGWKDDTAAVVAVHYAGQTADMPAIAAVARDHGAMVIEDSCHAVGGAFEHDGETHRVGGHRWADMSTFSFHPVKSMTAGEGGAIVTDNDDLADRLRGMRSHGMTRQPDDWQGLGDVDDSLAQRGPWYYEMHRLGFNYRITDLQCALASSQLKRLDGWIERRRQIVARYNAAFADLSLIQIPQLRNPNDQSLTSWHLYTIQIDFQTLGVTRSEVMDRLRQRGVGTQVLYIPVHLQPWYRQTYGYEVGKCPSAEALYRRSLSLPLFPLMSDQDVETVIESVSEAIA